jgi:hypothetical protein
MLRLTHYAAALATLLEAVRPWGWGAHAIAHAASLLPTHPSPACLVDLPPGRPQVRRSAGPGVALELLRKESLAGLAPLAACKVRLTRVALAARPPAPPRPSQGPLRPPTGRLACLWGSCSGRACVSGGVWVCVWQVLQHAYAAVVPIAPLPPPALPLPPFGPGPAFYGPSPEAASPWLPLALYSAARCGSPCRLHCADCTVLY